mmetsp:Transcript_26354/g.105496  ORF Transcript_26354/g.105496 Transcript_26354/m.105496 type:complete len:87 (-) Transcript_26354:1754-2014(-)
MSGDSSAQPHATTAARSSDYGSEDNSPDIWVATLVVAELGSCLRTRQERCPVTMLQTHCASWPPRQHDDAQTHFCRGRRRLRRVGW